MTAIALLMFTVIAATAALLAARQLVFLAVACALLSVVPLLFAANLPGPAFTWIAVVGPIAALGVILDSLRSFS